MRAPVLLSWWFYRNHSYESLFRGHPAVAPLLMLDSGAFSAYTQGGAVDIHAYGRWLKEWAPYTYCYVNLDVIYDPATSQRNQRILEDEHGLRPLPVFHAGTPWEHLDAMFDAGYEYICLGGMVPHAARSVQLRQWIRAAMRRAPSHVRFHGLGLGASRTIRDVPVYSADATSWINGSTRGNLPLFDPRVHHFVQWVRCADAVRYGAHFRSMGLNPNDIAAGYGDQHSPFRRACLIAMLVTVARWRAYLEARHGPVAAPNSHPGRLGPQLFIACGSGTLVRQMADYSPEASDEYDEKVVSA